MILCSVLLGMRKICKEWDKICCFVFVLWIMRIFSSVAL